MPLPSRCPVEVSGFDPHLGWHPQGDGKWYYGLSIENGRVKDEGPLRLRSGLRALVERFQPDLRLTPLQDILLCDLDAGARPEIERMLAEYGVSRPEQVSQRAQVQHGLPGDPDLRPGHLRIGAVLPGIIDQLEAELKRLGLEDEKLSVRMTGCPNGCARPYQSDIGLVGRSGDKYTLFVGGHVLGHRLNFLLKDLVPLPEIVPTLRPLLEHFKQERRADESFGDYCHRQGVERLQSFLPQQKAEVVHLTAKSHNGEPVVAASTKDRGSQNQIAAGARPATNDRSVDLPLTNGSDHPVQRSEPFAARCWPGSARGREPADSLGQRKLVTERTVLGGASR